MQNRLRIEAKEAYYTPTIVCSRQAQGGTGSTFGIVHIETLPYTTLKAYSKPWLKDLISYLYCRKPIPSIGLILYLLEYY